MGKLIVSEFVTLDGVMEAPGGEPSHPHSGWVFDYLSPEQERYKLDEVREADALLLGRVTYEGFSEAWPARGGEFADKMNSMPKYVASTTLRDPEWDNTTVLGADVGGEVAALKERHGGPVLVAGSCTLVHSLLADGLVDELRLMVFPVAVGGGLRLFREDREKLPFDHASTEVFPSGRAQAAFLLPAPSLDRLLAVAEEGDLLPAKSTWFEPKAPAGLVINDLGA